MNGGIFAEMTWLEIGVAVVDIAIVYYLIYRALLLIKGTRAAQMLIGLIPVGFAFFLAKKFELITFTWLLDNLINYAIIFFIVIFQHDIRRGLQRVGQNLFASGLKYEQTSVFEEIIRAADRLAQARVGALIVIERDADLAEYLHESGVEIDSKVTEELLVSLFLPDSENKLHDGAVIIRNLRIAYAGGLLPLSANAKLDKSLGTRHRAAIGLTEETDAVGIVVSEERGSISLCFDGNIARELDIASLRKALYGLFKKEKRREPAIKLPFGLGIGRKRPEASVRVEVRAEKTDKMAKTEKHPAVDVETSSVVSSPAGAAGGSGGGDAS